MRYSCLLLVLLVGCSRYDYVQQGETAIRVDKVTGRTEAMRRGASGGIEWVTLRTQDDIRTERERCATVRLPNRAKSDVAVRFDSPESVTLTNDSEWIIRSAVLIDGAGREVTVTRYWPDAPMLSNVSDLAPKTGGYFTGNPARLTAPVHLLALHGAPGDCRP